MFFPSSLPVVSRINRKRAACHKGGGEAQARKAKNEGGREGGRKKKQGRREEKDRQSSFTHMCKVYICNFIRF